MHVHLHYNIIKPIFAQKLQKCARLKPMEKDNKFIGYIEKSIIRNWDRDALTDHDTGTTLQFKDVARKIAKFHIIFESAGIKPGDKIALCGRN